jgi:hypothetical protein
MAYYLVQFFSALTNSWITLKEFDDSGGTLVAVFDSSEQLDLEEAQTRLGVLSRRYPHLAFRLDKVIA